MRPYSEYSQVVGKKQWELYPPDTWADRQLYPAISPQVHTHTRARARTHTHTHTHTHARARRAHTLAWRAHAALLRRCANVARRHKVPPIVTTIDGP